MEHEQSQIQPNAAIGTQGLETHAVLKKMKSKKEGLKDEVIYGVYNNVDLGWQQKIKDFFIDRGKVSLRDKAYFFHMLAVMVDAGIPVIQAVKILSYRTQSQRFRRVLNTIAHNAEGGLPLSEAMGRFDDVFDEADLGIVESGEATGRLSEMLFKLSDQLDKRHDLGMKLWGAATYPLAVMAILVLVSIGMLVWVFPTLLRLIEEAGVARSALPAATRVLIFAEEALVNYWWAILILIFGVYGIFLSYLRSENGAVQWDYAKLNMPIFGALMRKVYVFRFVSLIGILIESGLPVVKALQISANGLSNNVYRLKILEVIEQVKMGTRISESLGDSEFLFPPEVVQMISVGETSASLAKISEKVAFQYQREIDDSLKKVSSIFEPVMILVVGVLVALLALAVMAPIFNLSSFVRV